MKLILGSDAEQIIQEQLRTRKFSDAQAVVLAGLKSLLAGAPDEFEKGEMQTLLAEGEESIEKEGTLDADEALQARRAQAASKERGGMNLRISRLADRDIEQIWQFIARDSPTAATQVEDDIHAAMKLLVAQPMMGHQRRDIPDDRYRFW